MDFFGILFDMKNGKKVPYSKTYFDTLFAAKLAEMQIKTLTGTLPLTFRTSETALRSWTIYGNNTQHKYSTSGTLPLTFTTHTAGNADDWSISGNDKVGKNLLPLTDYSVTGLGNVTFIVDEQSGTVILNGSTTTSSGAQIHIRFTPTETLKVYFSGCPDGGGSGKYDVYCWDATANARCKKWDESTASASDYGAGSCEATLIAGHTIELNIRLFSGYTADNLTFKPMFRLPDTSATFDPYQIGVGQRTKNLLEITATTQEINRVTFSVDKQAGTITTNGTASGYAFIDMVVDIPQGTYIFTTNISGTGHTNVILRKNNAGKTFIATLSSTDYSYTVDSDGIIIRFAVADGVSVSNEINTPMIRLAGTSADFVPYGYELPITVNNTTQNIYIGDTPLTAGQSVSKTSTGVDIAAIAGSNTITTELYNKPEMAIEGVDYVGVGEPVNDGWQIPLTVSDGTNTATVNVPIDAPLTEGQSVTDTLTISTFEGANTIDTTLENKPKMKITYKGG